MIRVQRFAYSPMGTFARIVAGAGEFRCYTVERPWQQNKPSVSCVPEGTYEAVLGMYHRGGYPAYELLNVPGRTLIKIHRANLATEVSGCLAPGIELGSINGKWAVLRSGEALQQLHDALGWAERTVVEITAPRVRAFAESD